MEETNFYVGFYAKYNERFHAERVLHILSNFEMPCSMSVCPGEPYFRIPWVGGIDYLEHKIIFACPICRKFAGIDRGECPCPTLGKEENIKRSWLKLKEMGLV